MEPVPHGEPYAGNLHVRFDERGIRRKTAKHVLRVAEGRAGVPYGASRSTLHPVEPAKYRTCLISVLSLITVLVSLPVFVFLLWFLVRTATTSYCLEWVGFDDRVWEEMRELPIEDGGRLFVMFDYLNYKRKDQYAITVESDCNLSLEDGAVTLQFVGRDEQPFQLYMMVRDLRIGRRRYFSALPLEFMPRKENDVLLIKFKVCTNGGSVNNEIVLKFKARLVRHYVDLITDIT